jgi:predicted RNase H-like nuclease (RuvC/YqgF family)
MRQDDLPDNHSLKIGNRVEYEKYQRLEQKLDELQDALHDLGEYGSELEDLMEKYDKKSFSLREEYDKELLSTLTNN